jgi:hypothetical protein
MVCQAVAILAPSGSNTTAAVGCTLSGPGGVEHDNAARMEHRLHEAEELDGGHVEAKKKSGQEKS